MPTIAAAFRTAAHATAAEAPGNRGITTSRETRYIPAMTEVPRARPGLGAVAIASVAVLAGALLTAFRVAPAQDLTTLLAVQGPRVLFDAGAGALLALAGALRHASDGERPMRELEWLAGSVGAAAGGFGAVVAAPNAPVWIAFAVGAVAGGALLFAAARALDRPHRATNLGVLALIAVAIFAAALAGTYVRARHDAVAAIVTWLLGDLTGATGRAAAVLLAAAAAIVVLGARALARGDKSGARNLAWIATGVGVGAAGPLAFVGGMVPRAVRWLAPIATDAARLSVTALAGAATVAAIDAVPRLLVGGYDFPFNVPAALLAIPIYTGWNHARLRRELGPAGWYEPVELAAIAVATLVATALAVQLTAVVHSLT
jgi:iron complex transport system permease protein